jgi:hypothetical protein
LRLPGRRAVELAWSVAVGAPAWLAAFVFLEHLRIQYWDFEASKSALAAILPAALVAWATGAYFGRRYAIGSNRVRMVICLVGFTLVAVSVWQFLKFVTH